MFWKLKKRTPSTCGTSWFVKHEYDAWGDVFTKPGLMFHIEFQIEFQRRTCKHCGYIQERRVNF